VVVWDAVNGGQVRTWSSVAPGEMAGLAFSPDGKTLAFGDKDGTIHLCEVDGKKETTIASTGTVAALAFSKDGKQLASATKGRVVLWDVAERKEVRHFDVERGEGVDEMAGEVAHLAFPPDGKTLAVSVLFRRIELWDTETGKIRDTLHGDFDRQCAFSADGKWLTAAGHGRLFLWDAATGEPLYPGHDNYIDGLWFSPDDKTLISRGSEQLCLWDMASGKLKAERGRLYYWPVISPDGRLMADAVNKGKEVRVQEVATGKTLHVIRSDERLRPSQLSPDGKTLVANYACDGAQITALWDTATGKELHEIHVHKGMIGPAPFGPMALSPDGKLLAVYDPNIPLTLQPPPMGGFPPANPAPPAPPHLGLWDMKSGTKRRDFEFQTFTWPREVVFSPNSRLIVAPDWSDRVYVREIATGKVATSWEVKFPWGGAGQPEGLGSVSALAVSPDGRTLATACNLTGTTTMGGIKLWDLDSGEELHRIWVHTKSQISALAFSRDGKRLASGGMQDGMILVWDVADVTTRPRPKALELTDKERGELWDRLADADAAKGRAALAKLARVGDAAADFIAARLKDLPQSGRALADKRLEALIADLDNDDYETRERATKELAAAAAKVADVLRQRLRDGKVSPEARRRMEKVLAGVEARDQGANDRVLQWLRAAEVLERIGTPAARKVLEKIAAVDGPIADDAKAALER
jgi:Tol biopolymer transport system component